MKRTLKCQNTTHGLANKLNLEKLKRPTQAADLFVATIGGKFEAFNLLEENIDKLTENIHAAFADAASEVLWQSHKEEETVDDD